MYIIVVAAGIIEHEGKILLAQRQEGAHQGLKWEFPGGKLEFGETPEQCLVREIQEELNIEIKIDQLFQVVSHVYGERQVVLICYRCSYLSGALDAKECHNFCWVEKKDLMNYDLAPADIPVAQNLLKK
ncbi:8-oxo-dGTP diphosphatase MutT [Candidatus Formimonas warabiya]|uniref:8-oxo-dGTP diphosphatase MutT n=1 Tax=Formimonas warabiya TaxID=1761012 RepID=UPI0011D0A69A|nr:8-oxo-dGTP diphosphatase MutT [Candidatus Formimonas warabiya]